jgi:hypothetical protein
VAANDKYFIVAQFNQWQSQLTKARKDPMDLSKIKAMPLPRKQRMGARKNDVDSICDHRNS